MARWTACGSIPGYPAVADREGRLAKPLVAILCMDLDSRLNVNAPGRWRISLRSGRQPVGIMWRR